MGRLPSWAYTGILGRDMISLMEPCVCRAFDNLRDVRGLEYELDFVTNRANRDLQVNTCPPSCTSYGIISVEDLARHPVRWS